MANRRNDKSMKWPGTVIFCCKIFYDFPFIKSKQQSVNPNNTNACLPFWWLPSCQAGCPSIYVSSANLPVCLFLNLLVCLSALLGPCAPVCLSAFRSACFTAYLSIFLSFCLSVFLSFCLSVFLSFCLSVFLYLSLSVCLSVCLSIKLLVCLWVYLFECVSQRVSVSVCLSVCPSICLPLSKLFYVKKPQKFFPTFPRVVYNSQCIIIAKSDARFFWYFYFAIFTLFLASKRHPTVS
jgi:hypothetical protein